MFGYVKLYKPAITMGEYEQYRGIYCTLCRRLGKRYGITARMSLSYDMTFLALLRLATESEDPDFCPGRCSFNPAKRCLKCRHTDSVDYAADISVLMTYYKTKDTLADEGFGKRLAAMLIFPIVALHHRKAARLHPEEEKAMATMMQNQRQTEQQKTPSLDASAHSFADFLGTLLSRPATDESNRRILSRLGYCLGRWIYFADAVDDWEADRKKGRYNPFLFSPLPEGETLQSYMTHVLNANLAEVTAAYRLLPVCRFQGILENILEQGLPHEQQRLLTKGESV